MELTELEKFRVTNDNEVQELDPEDPSYMPSADPGEFKPQATSSAGYCYLNKIMGPFYMDGPVEEALTQ